MSATVELNATVVHEVDERYVSFTMDGSYNRGFFERNLTNPLLNFLVKQLSPAVLRFGGSGNDYLQYDVPAGQTPTAPACLPGQSYPEHPGTNACPPWSDAKNCKELAAQPGFCASAERGPQPNCCHECGINWNVTNPGGCSIHDGFAPHLWLTCNCLTQQRFDDLLAFAGDGNLSLVFGLSFADDVNSSKTTALLRHVAAGDHPVWGYEYGNERDGRPPQMPSEFSSLP